MSELKILAGKLRSYKGWLTQAINNCLELVKLPTTAANASFMVDRLDSALSELDERRAKVDKCLEDMEAIEFDKEDTQDRKEKEKYYEDQRGDIAARCQSVVSKVSDVYSKLKTVGENNGSNAPAPIASTSGATNISPIKVQDSLKPFVLSIENTPYEFLTWKKEFKAFYSASNLNQLSISGQQAFFKKHLDQSLLSVLDPLINSTTPIFDENNMPGLDSCFHILEKEFLLRYPLVTRRFEFFNQSQKKGQFFTEYFGKN